MAEAPVKKPGGNTLGGILSAVVLFCIVGSIVRGLSGAGSPTAAPTPAFSAPERPLPTSGRAYHMQSGLYSVPLTIITPNTDFHYLKIRDKATDKTVEAFFLYPGTTVKTFVPFGTYTMQYAAGEKWYGQEILFGPETRYCQFEEDFLFEKNYEYSLEMIEQTSGNLHVDVIDAAQFGDNLQSAQTPNR